MGRFSEYISMKVNYYGIVRIYYMIKYTASVLVFYVLTYHRINNLLN